MKKLLFVSFIVLLVFNSCNEDFDPYGDLVNKYVLNCVIRTDTTYQTAFISRTYIVDNLDPLSYDGDPNIHDAVVRIFNGENFVQMTDTLITLPGTGRSAKYYIFQTHEFKLDRNASIKVEAVLPNGKTLSGKTYAVAEPKFLEVATVIPPANDSTIVFAWNKNQLGSIYLTRLGIKYYLADDTSHTIRTYYVPDYYLIKNGKDYAVYPNVGSENVYELTMETFNKAMFHLSDDDIRKSNYVILYAALDVFSLDKNLSDYYNAVNRGKDIYSVKLNDSDFSVVSGAYGVVGSFTTRELKLRFTHNYIKSFNYTPGLADVVR